ncbi:hypothetical protein ACFQNF_06565 [Iodobacter arcticus]|uniref:Uncharacterized protein n=1 Tax=Iodobacter arcticus TaxID=590593 RepID=A0ABW2QVL9_9NEIS
MKKMEIHMDGGMLSSAHEVSARTLGKILTSTQRAVDKTIYNQKHGSLEKYSQLKAAELHEADFIVEKFKAGSLIIPLKQKMDNGNDIPSLLKGHLNEYYLKSKVQFNKEVAQIDLTLKLDTYTSRTRSTLTSNETIEKTKEKENIEYSNYAITKEFSDLLSIVRAKKCNDEAFVEIKFNSDYIMTFRKFESNNLQEIIATTGAGTPLIYEGYVTSLGESKNQQFPFQMKIRRKHSDKEFSVHIRSHADAQECNRFNTRDVLLKFWGSPLIKGNSADPIRGDVFFLNFIG